MLSKYHNDDCIFLLSKTLSICKVLSGYIRILVTLTLFVNFFLIYFPFFLFLFVVVSLILIKGRSYHFHIGV